jgi:hypothetical protein
VPRLEFKVQNGKVVTTGNLPYSLFKSIISTLERIHVALKAVPKFRNYGYGQISRQHGGLHRVSLYIVGKRKLKIRLSCSSRSNCFSPTGGPRSLHKIIDPAIFGPPVVPVVIPFGKSLSLASFPSSSFVEIGLDIHRSYYNDGARIGIPLVIQVIVVQHLCHSRCFSLFTVHTPSRSPYFFFQAFLLFLEVPGFGKIPTFLPASKWGLGLNRKGFSGLEICPNPESSPHNMRSIQFSLPLFSPRPSRLVLCVPRCVRFTRENNGTTYGKLNCPQRRSHPKSRHPTTTICKKNTKMGQAKH